MLDSSFYKHETKRMRTRNNTNPTVIPSEVMHRLVRHEVEGSLSCRRGKGFLHSSRNDNEGIRVDSCSCSCLFV